MRRNTLTAVPESLRRPMTPEESAMFFKMTMTPDFIATPDGIEEALGEQGMAIFAIAVMIKRLQNVKPLSNYSLNAILFVTSLCDSPGKVVMWAYTLAEETRKGGVCNMSALVDLFPHGFPTDAGYSQIWDAQKLSREERGDGWNDNWLDTQAAWQ